MTFAARAYAAFVLTATPIFAMAMTKNVPLTWKVGGVMTRLFMRLSGIPFLVRGRDNIPPGPVVLAPNHTSYLDALVLIAILGPRQFSFIAKREFVDNWVMRTLLEGFGTVFVERFDVQKSAEHADELAEAAKQGESLAIFPEGTLLRRPGLLPFPHRRVPGRGAGRHPGGADGAARRALGAARRHLVPAPLPDRGHHRRADRAGRQRLECRGPAARPRARRSPEVLRRSRILSS